MVIFCYAFWSGPIRMGGPKRMSNRHNNKHKYTFGQVWRHRSEDIHQQQKDMPMEGCTQPNQLIWWYHCDKCHSTSLSVWTSPAMKSNQKHSKGVLLILFKGAGATGAEGAAAPVALVVRGQRGGSKVQFPKKLFPRNIYLYQYSMKVSCFSSAVTIIEQLLLLLRPQYIRRRCLAQYAKRRFPICLNSKFWHQKMPVLRFLPPPHYEASGTSDDRCYGHSLSLSFAAQPK